MYKSLLSARHYNSEHDYTIQKKSGSALAYSYDTPDFLCIIFNLLKRSHRYLYRSPFYRPVHTHPHPRGYV